MKTFVSLGIAAVLAASAAPASVITVGSTFAASCYRAAESRDAGFDTMRACDSALSNEALTSEDRVATHVNRGILFLVDRNLARATADFDQALSMDPQQAEAWLNKGIVALERGDSHAARAMADKALALGTRKPALAHYVRAAAGEDLGDVRSAYADLVRAKELEPRWLLPAQELTRFQVRRP